MLVEESGPGARFHALPTGALRLIYELRMKDDLADGAEQTTAPGDGEPALSVYADEFPSRAAALRNFLGSVLGAVSVGRLVRGGHLLPAPRVFRRGNELVVLASVPMSFGSSGVPFEPDGASGMTLAWREGMYHATYHCGAFAEAASEAVAALVAEGFGEPLARLPGGPWPGSMRRAGNVVFTGADGSRLELSFVASLLRELRLFESGGEPLVTARITEHPYSKNKSEAVFTSAPGVPELGTATVYGSRMLGFRCDWT